MKKNVVKLVFIISLTFFVVGQLSAKRVIIPKMYMFGMAASFNDTIIHFTNVMEVDSVWIEKKNNFLLGRNYYSHQLRDYLATHEQLAQRTCITVFAKNRAKAEKKLLKMIRLYTKSKDGNKHFDVRFIDDKAFRYHTINIREYEESEDDINTSKEETKSPKSNGRKKGKRGDR